MFSGVQVYALPSAHFNGGQCYEFWERKKIFLVLLTLLEKERVRGCIRLYINVVQA